MFKLRSAGIELQGWIEPCDSPISARGWGKMAVKFKMAGANGLAKNVQNIVDFLSWIKVFTCMLTILKYASN